MVVPNPNPNLLFYENYEKYDLLTAIENSVTKLDKLYCQNTEFSIKFQCAKMERNLENCGYRLSWLHKDQIHTYELPYHCYNRICPKKACILARKLRIKQRVEKLWPYYHSPQFVTLTFRGHFSISKKHLAHISKCWIQFIKALKRPRGDNKIPLVLTPIKYIKVVEMRKKALKRYYFHIHALIDMPHISKKVLMHLWYKISGSYMVDIQEADFDSLDYLLKYMYKSAYYPMDIIDYVKYCKNSRFISISGFAPNLSLKKGKGSFRSGKSNRLADFSYNGIVG